MPKNKIELPPNISEDRYIAMIIRIATDITIGGNDWKLLLSPIRE